MIYVVAYITTKPGKRDEMLEAFNANLPNVRAETGCIEYGPLIDVDTGLAMQQSCGADTFVVLEKWESLQALEAHTKAPRSEGYASKAKALITGSKAHILAVA